MNGSADRGLARDSLESVDDYARRLIESGDMGYRPGQRYPRLVGGSERAQIWLASMGLTEGDHLRNVAQQAQSDAPDIYVLKFWRRPRSNNPSPKARLISAAQFRNAHNAVTFANRLGAVLDTHITISWSLLGFDSDTDATEALQMELIKPMREWFRHKEDPLSRPFAWLYVHEQGKKLGMHTHLLVFVPIEWRADFKKWLINRIGRIAPRRNLAGKPVVLRMRDDRPIYHQWRNFGYLMKGFDPNETVAAFSGSSRKLRLGDLVPWEQECPGEVRCKLRLGCAQVIGAKARAEAGFRSLLDDGVTDVKLLDGDHAFACWRLEMSYQQAAEAEKLGTATRSVAEVEWEMERLSVDMEKRRQAWLQRAKDREPSSMRSNDEHQAMVAAVAKLLGGREVRDGRQEQPDWTKAGWPRPAETGSQLRHAPSPATGL